MAITKKDSRYVSRLKQQQKETKDLISKAKKLEKYDSAVKLIRKAEKQGRKIEFQKRVDSNLDKVNRVANNLMSFNLGGKILKKPNAKLPSYSAVKVVKQLADEQNRLVREVPEKEIVEDKRSLFFKREYVGEKKWLS